MARSLRDRRFRSAGLQQSPPFTPAALVRIDALGAITTLKELKPSTAEGAMFLSWRHEHSKIFFRSDGGDFNLDRWLHRLRQTISITSSGDAEPRSSVRPIGL